jgi:radical SAM protein with 4Fe4S-binding SPASM domain
MVTAGQPVPWTRRALLAIGNDLRELRRAAGGRRGARLHTYDVRFSGGRRRLHLRTEADGSATLLVDVSDVIRLNPTAALLARLALDSVPLSRAAKILRRHFRHVSAEQAQAAASKIYAMVDRLTHPANGSCPTCGLAEAERLPWFSLPVSAPYKADLALGYGCNNACPHCYNPPPSPFAPPPSPLAPPDWRRVLRRLAAIGIPHVIFTGGEPTLFPGLPDLIREAARLGLVTGLNTNGRRLSDARFVSSLRAAGLEHVQITLQSHDREIHNAMSGAESFDETLAGVRNAVATGLHAITNTTLTTRNVDHAGQMVEFLDGLGLRTFAMNGIIFAGGGRNSTDALPAETLAPVLADVRDRAARLSLRFLWYTPTRYCRLSPVELELGPRRCNAGQYSICIEPNGDVIPCQSYYVPAGNILRDPWERIWQSDLFRSFRFRTGDPQAAGLPQECWTCPELPVCGGGCRLEAEAIEERSKMMNAE